MKIDLKKLPIINRDEATYNKLLKNGTKIYMQKIDDIVHAEPTGYKYVLNTMIRFEISYETFAGHKRIITIDEWFSYVNGTAEVRMTKLAKQGYKNIKVRAIAIIKYLTKKDNEGWYLPISK